MESLNCKIQIISSMHHNLLWGKFPIQEQTCLLRLQFSNFPTCESPISKHESSVLTESIKQYSQFARKSWKGFPPPPHTHRVETLYSASCTAWRDLTRNWKNQMLFLILTPSCCMTLDSFLHLVTIPVWLSEAMRNQKQTALERLKLTINFKKYVSLITLYNSVH